MTPEELIERAKTYVVVGTDGTEVNLGEEIERLRDALWRARADLDNAHRNIMPHIHNLAHDAIRVAQIVDPPAHTTEEPSC
ncbi:MAG: hypothetical protein AAFQ58_19300 [Pseudomonadota bacterium]